MRITDRILSYCTNILLLSILLFLPQHLNAQLHNSCDALNNCHNYFGTEHLGELILCGNCEQCADQGACTINQTTQPLVYSFVAISPSVSVTIGSPDFLINFFCALYNEDYSECYDGDGNCDAGIQFLELSSDELEVGKIYNISMVGCQFIPTGTIELAFDEGMPGLPHRWLATILLDHFGQHLGALDVENYLRTLLLF